MATALTTARLLLVVPVAGAIAQRDLFPPGVLLAMLGLAVATDYLDGRVARMTSTASPRGQLFDHGTDFVFVTAGLSGGAAAGLVTPVLPVLITVAFSQYVLDSYFFHRQKQLRMSMIGRWNGILYFVPLFLIAATRLRFAGDGAAVLVLATGALGYGLVVSTAVSIIDRAIAPRRRASRDPTTL